MKQFEKITWVINCSPENWFTYELRTTYYAFWRLQVVNNKLFYIIISTLNFSRKSSWQLSIFLLHPQSLWFDFFVLVTCLNCGLFNAKAILKEGVLSDMLDGDIVIITFEILSYDYFHFHLQTIVWIHLSTQHWVKYYHCYISTKRILALNHSKKLVWHK